MVKWLGTNKFNCNFMKEGKIVKMSDEPNTTANGAIDFDILQPSNDDCFVSLINVNKIYDKNVHAVYDFNLNIKRNEFIVLVGPSGCGKSTTLRMIAGLEDITNGELYINGKLSNDIPSKDRDIAMVFQSYALYPNMNVYNNMAFSLKVRHYPADKIKERVLEVAKILELEDYLERKPKQLSGGQKQRVALGRAIVRNAQLFLLDEPLSNLDAKLRVQMRSEIIRLHKKANITSIYVTHDQTEAMTMADRIVVMKNGWIQQVGTPYEIYKHPANKFVASFIGSPAMNFINAKYCNGKLSFSDGFEMKLSDEQIKSHDDYYHKLQSSLEEEITLMLEQEIGQESSNKRKKKDIKELTEEDIIKKKNETIEIINDILTNKEHDIIFGIRPESIKEVDEGEEGFEKTISLAELLGDEYYIHILFGGKDILAKITTENLIISGQKVKLKINQKRIHLFDPITKKTIF